MGVSTASVEVDLAALDKRFSALIASSDQLVGDSLKGAAADSAAAMGARLKSAQSTASEMQANTTGTVQEAAGTLRWRIGMGLAVVGFGVLLLLAVVLGRRVVNRLKMLIAAMDDLAAGEGDLTKRVQIHSKDEIGDMASAVNRFVDKLQPIVREAGDVAQRTGVEIGAMTLRNAGLMRRPACSVMKWPRACARCRKWPMRLSRKAMRCKRLCSKWWTSVRRPTRTLGPRRRSQSDRSVGWSSRHRSEGDRASGAAK